MRPSLVGSLETGRNGGQPPEKLFWNETERQDSLARNAVISAFDRGVIAECISHRGRYRRPASLADVQPSEKIVEAVGNTRARIRSQHAVSIV